MEGGGRPVIAGPWHEAPTDEERDILFDQFCEHRDPRRLPGFIENQPMKHWDYDPVFSFDWKPGPSYGDERFYCSTCDTHVKFYDGVLVWYEDGHLRLVGHNCGQEFYEHAGGEFLRRVNRRAAKDRRRQRIRIWTKIQPFVERLDFQLTRFEARADIPALFQLRHQLRGRMPHLWNELHRSMELGRTTNVLYITRRLAAPRRIGNQIQRYEDVEYSTFRGGSALRQANNPRLAAEKAHVVCRGAIEAGSFADLKDAIQQEMIRKLNDIVLPEAGRAAEILTEARQLVEPTNVAMVCRWATANPACKGRYELSGNSMIWHEGGSEVQLPPIGDCVELLRAINALRFSLAEQHGIRAAVHDAGSP